MDIQHEQEGGEHTALRRVPLLSTTVQIVWLPHLKCLWSVCEEVLSEKPYSSYFSILPVIPEQSFSLICIAVFMLYDMFVQKLKALLWMWPISVSNMPLRDSQSLPVRSSFISVMKNACSCEETLMDGVKSLQLAALFLVGQHTRQSVVLSCLWDKASFQDHGWANSAKTITFNWDKVSVEIM